MQRPINKDYYFIDFHATIDAIKYRMFHLTEKVKEMYRPSQEKKDYFCPQCRAQWTQLEVLDKFGPMGFECHRCGGILEREEQNEGDSTGHEKQSRLMSQLDGFIKMLQKVDSQDIPANDFDTAFSLAVPIQRDPAVNPLRPTVPVGPSGPPTAVKGLTQAAIVPLDVSVTTSNERTAAEQAEAAKLKANIAAQNVLPVWHTTSTVTGEVTKAGQKECESFANGNAALKEEGEEKKDRNILSDELTAYYAQMIQEKEKEAREDQEADESSGEDEEEFEDVAVGTSNVDTPSSSVSIGASGGRDLQSQDSEIRKDSESGSSAPGSNMPTPADLELQAEDEAPLAKRVKFETQENELGESKPAVDDSGDKVSDEDDDAEFEDAL